MRWPLEFPQVRTPRFKSDDIAHQNTLACATSLSAAHHGSWKRAERNFRWGGCAGPRRRSAVRFDVLHHSQGSSPFAGAVECWR